MPERRGRKTCITIGNATKREMLSGGLRDRRTMKLLVYGAGVLGSLYAAKLKEAGHDAAILARGKRLEEIKTNGLVLEDAARGTKTVTRIDVVEALNPDDAYDTVFVIVPKQQVGSVLPVLSANKSSKSIMFMLNNPSGLDEWAQAAGPARLLVGFPGAAGSRQDGIVRYRILPKLMQPTTIGEPQGTAGDRINALKGALQKAGFPTSVCTNMDAWLKYHVAWTSPMLNAIYVAGGNGPALAADRATMRLMIQAIREGFAVLKALGFPLTPSKLRVNWDLFPISAMLVSTPLIFKSKLFEDVAGGHARAALPEFKVLSDEFQVLARSTNLPTPAIDELHNHLTAKNHAIV